MPRHYGTPIILSSTRDAERADSVAVRSSEFAPTSPIIWSVQKRTLHGGKQEGVELVVIDNGALQITVIPTRGMSVLSVQAGDLRLSWDSPVKEIVHPHFINLHDRGGLGWLDGFKEWMVRCGLEFAGHPGTDRFVNNVGDSAEMNLTLHGKIGNTPASHVEVVVDEAPPHRIHLRGIVRECVLHGPKLMLQTTISTEPGSTNFQVLDAVTNASSGPQEFQLIYHVNYGRPLLDAGAKFVAPVKSISPMNDRSAKALDSFAEYLGPQAGFIEEVFLAELHADPDGMTQVMLKNSNGDAAAMMRWPVNQLPCFTLWKHTAAESDGYVTGLEPGTSYPFNRSVERAGGRVPTLAPGETRLFAIGHSLLRGTVAVSRSEATIRELQDMHPPLVKKHA